MTVKTKIEMYEKETEENFNERVKKAIEEELVEAGLDPEQVDLKRISMGQGEYSNKLIIETRPK